MNMLHHYILKTHLIFSTLCFVFVFFLLFVRVYLCTASIINKYAVIEALYLGWANRPLKPQTQPWNPWPRFWYQINKSTTSVLLSKKPKQKGNM